ncbi:GATA zinc finger domain containing protein [Gracilaria domingensis]|nr:GATA zinc finger domain containing protein [Gracilaria domingensis]
MWAHRGSGRGRQLAVCEPAAGSTVAQLIRASRRGRARLREKAQEKKPLLVGRRRGSGRRAGMTRVGSRRGADGLSDAPVAPPRLVKARVRASRAHAAHSAHSCARCRAPTGAQPAPPRAHWWHAWAPAHVSRRQQWRAHRAAPLALRVAFDALRIDSRARLASTRLLAQRAVVNQPRAPRSSRAFLLLARFFPLLCAPAHCCAPASHTYSMKRAAPPPSPSSASSDDERPPLKRGRSRTTRRKPPRVPSHSPSPSPHAAPPPPQTRQLTARVAHLLDSYLESTLGADVDKSPPVTPSHPEQHASPTQIPFASLRAPAAVEHFRLFKDSQPGVIGRRHRDKRRRLPDSDSSSDEEDAQRMQRLRSVVVSAPLPPPRAHV